MVLLSPRQPKVSAVIFKNPFPCQDTIISVQGTTGFMHPTIKHALKEIP